GKLTALRYPERELVSVAAHQVWYEPARPLAAAPAPARRELNLSDVTGRRVIETSTHGRISVRAEQAAAALEVMSRFAVEPRLLDAELLPWSAKAGKLIIDQYASVGAAATSALPAAAAALSAAAGRGVDVANLLVHNENRLANAQAFREAYRRYCWPTDGLAG